MGLNLRNTGVKQATVLDLGHLAYTPTFDIQRNVLEEVVRGERPNTLIFVEHDPVLTLGANFHESNLLLPRKQYAELGIEVLPTDRGGDVTYHGPNQLVIYPIFNVAEFGRDLHRWLRDLEEAILIALAEFGLKGERSPVNTGVWVKDKKVAAIGVKVRRWVSMHGMALNCNNDLSPFETIIPCGVKTHGVTSISAELGRGVTIEEAKPAVVRGFEQAFDLSLQG